MSYARKSFIKAIRLELPGYRYHHKPYKPFNGENFRFIGREKIRKEFLDTLLNGSSNGAYLVTGYRGMGKTSFVNKVLEDFDVELKQQRRGRLQVVNISLGKSDVRHEDLLRQLILAIQMKVLGPFHRVLARMIKPSNIVLLSLFTYFWLLVYLAFRNQWPDLDTEIGIVSSFLLLTATVSFLFGYLFMTFFSIVASLSPTMRIYSRLNNLYARCSSEVSEEENVQSLVKNVNVGFFTKAVTKYPPLSIKEVELQLIEIIKRLDRTTRPYSNKLMEFRHRFFRNFNRWLAKHFSYFRENIYVFVFDEMDKIEPGVGGNDYFQGMKDVRTSEDERTNINEYRDKRQMMVNILSSLKNLISESNARYIFITGREMFEASLADIADRQYSVGSIFHKIIYVDSFLKDSVGPVSSGLSNVIENHLKAILLPKDYMDDWDASHGERKAKDEPFLKLYFDLLCTPKYMLTTPSEEEILKIIYAIQQFIIYLTYRSNGSPKKVARLIEELIVVSSIDPLSPAPDELYIQATFKEQIAPKKKGKAGKIDVRMLELSYSNQFRFGFITYLYRPFLLTYSRRIKNYSDYLLVSTTYLVDHILKFHPFAFSTRNLELVPEVLSTNRTPQLRSFIDELLNFLSLSYIRETEIDLFEFKFYTKVANEILYLSSLFEQESAAFNFTLDESYAIKIHIRNKILELRKIHKDFRSTQYEYIHSISALNNLLGDVRFFDQEYTDAITAYSDAVQELRNIKIEESKVETVLLLIQLQLKLGLTYEKIKSYDSALSYFTDAMDYTAESLNAFYGADPPKNLPPAPSAKRTSVHELLQVSVHAFMANLYLMEKMSQPGIDLDRIADAYRIIEKILCLPNNKMLKADFFHHAATLVFYKNLYIHNLESRETNCRLFSDLAAGKSGTVMKELAVNQSEVPDFRYSNLALWLNCVALRSLIEHYDRLNPQAMKISDIQIKDWLPNTIGRSFEIILIDSFQKIVNKTLLRNIAILLSRIGDSLLTTIVKKKVSDEILFHHLIMQEILDADEAYRKSNRSDLKQFKQTILTQLASVVKNGITGSSIQRLRLVLACYYVSGKYYSLAGKIASCSYQYRRIFKAITSVMKFDRTKIIENKFILDFLEMHLLREVLRNTSTNTNSTDRIQIRKFKYFFDEGDIYNPRSYTRSMYSSISNNPETREVILFFAEVKLRAMPLVFNGVCGSLRGLLEEQELVLPTNIIASQWIRMLELRLQGFINKKIKTEYFDVLFDAAWPDNRDTAENYSMLIHWRRKQFPIYARTPPERRRDIIHNEPGNKPFSVDELKLARYFSILRKPELSADEITLLCQFRELVANSIHVLNHLLEILQTYGNSYPAGFSFIGDIYRYHSRWMIYFYLVTEFENMYPEFASKGTPIKHEVERLIGKENFRNAEPYGLSQSAQLFYYRTLDLHHEGHAYKTRIQTLNYLDDDFSDGMSHFAAALERQRVNSGKIRTHINDMERLLQQSQLFRYDSFVNNAPIELNKKGAQ